MLISDGINSWNLIKTRFSTIQQYSPLIYIGTVGDCVNQKFNNRVLKCSD